MKKLVSLLMALVLVFAMSSVAMAATVTDQNGLRQIFEAGGEATLDNNITLTSSGLTVDDGKTVTLDLNGHELSYTSTKGAADALIINKGTLIINDSSNGEGKMTFCAEPASAGAVPSYASNTISNEGGHLTINGGTLKNTTAGTAAYVVDNNNTLGDTTLIVNGGKLEQTQTSYSGAIRLFANHTTYTNTINIDGGEVIGRRTIWIQLPGSSQQNKLAELNITGGKIQSTDPGRDLAIYVFSHGDSYSATKINISDGTIDGNIEFKDAKAANDPGNPIPANDKVGEFNITGGTFEGTINNATQVGNAVDIGTPVSGGIFTDPDAFEAIEENGYLNPSVADQIKFDPNTGKTYVGDSIPVPPAPKRYDVNVAATANGDVTVKGSASYDSGVIITATPYYGYEVGKVTVTDANGKDVKVTNRADGTYSFSMPRGEVTIKVTFVPQGEAVKMVLTIGSKAVDVNGQAVTNDVAPVIKNSRTFLPVRLIAENLGAKVEWNNDAQTVTVTKGDTVIVLTVGSTTVTVNGQPAELEAPVFIENSRTYLPVRFIAEKLGADVEWNGATNEVTITGRK